MLSIIKGIAFKTDVFSLIHEGLGYDMAAGFGSGVLMEQKPALLVALCGKVLLTYTAHFWRSILLCINILLACCRHALTLQLAEIVNFNT